MDEFRPVERRDDDSAQATPLVDLYLQDNLEFLSAQPDSSFDLIYVDPPFNTGKRRERTNTRVRRDLNRGDRSGFGGHRYVTERVGKARAYADDYPDFLGFLEPRLREAHRVLKADGSLFVHLDSREVHYAKVLLDTIFGRASFQNEIIWAYDYGARSKSRWPSKHDNILWYSKDPKRFTFDLEQSDRIPYMAPTLVGAEKAARGKTPTDTWWHTIVSPTGNEKTGYPTQKPLGVLERIVRVHSREGERVLDFFAGSGTTGEAAVRNGRAAVLVDDNPDAVQVMQERLAFAHPRLFTGDSETQPRG